MRLGGATFSRRTLIFVASAVALAGLILGLAALQDPASRDEFDSLFETVEPGVLAQTYATDAAEALRSGDETLALELATKALTAQPGNAAAQSVADEVRKRRAAGTRPSDARGDQSGGEGAPGGSSGDDGDVFLGAISDLSTLLPTSFPDYGLGTPASLGDSASLSGSATGRGTAPTRVVWSINDAGSAKSADEFVTKTSRNLYGSDSADVTIDGVAGYFGTDGTRFATVVYTRGRYVFEVVASGDAAKPVEYRQVLLAAASAFKDSP